MGSARRPRMARRRGHRPRRWRLAGLLGAVGLIGFALGLWVGRRSEPAAPAPLAGPPPGAPAAGVSTRSGPSRAPAEYPPAAGGRVAVVIDDLGRSLEPLAGLAALGIPVSYAVLPFEPRTAEVVAALGGRGAEVLCHLPMEGAPGVDPGPGALLRSMSRRELAQATREALHRVPGAVGVNNHMGSRFAGDLRLMEPVLEEIGRQGLFFLDSRTSADSVAYALARERGIPAAERQVFLDADPRPVAVAGEFARLLELARTRGAAIAIGHPTEETLAVLRREVPRALAAGYEFVPVSYLLDRVDVLPR